MSRLAGSVGAFLALAICFAAGLGLADEDDPGHHSAISAAASHETNESDDAHDAHGQPALNWTYGFIGEKEGVEPSLMYRPTGMAPPLLAQIFNTAVLFILLYTLGKKPLAEGLKKRKIRIVSSMEEAGRMRDEAAVSLAEYEHKLQHIEQEIERVRREMHESANAERQRILADAKERRERMERDAKLLVEQELKVAREHLVEETVLSAMRSAEQLISGQLTPSDEDRLARDAFVLLGKAQINAGGGRA